MTVESAATLSGLFFWLIIITNVGSNGFGYQTFGDLKTEADLEKISADPGKFRIGFVLIVIEHLCIIFLVILLFIAFGQYSPVIGLVWLISRSIEGIIQIINKKNYWRLLTVAQHYTTATDAEKEKLDAERLSILESKYANFLFAQILFAVGTLSYSVLFVTYELVPPALGWFGIVAAILYGIGNAMTRMKPDSKALWNIAGLLILIYEVILGGWLLFG